MSVSKYKTFLEVVRCRSMRRAATNLNQTPSAVSYTISSLESELGLPLFIRSKSKITLTDFGQTILAPVNALLDAEKKLMDTIDAFNNPTGGVIRLGGVQLAIARYLPALTKLMQANHPNISVTPVVSPFETLTEDLMAGAFDIALIPAPESKQLDFIPMLSNNIHFILPDYHPLIARPTLSFSDLPNESFIVPSWKGEATYLKMIQSANIDERIAYTINDVNTLIGFVQSGLGVGILPTTTLPVNCQCEYPIIEEAPTSEFGFALPSQKSAPIPVKKFIRLAKGYFMSLR